MNFKLYQEKVLGFMNPRVLESKEEMLINGVLGLGGESGECLDLIKKWAFHDRDLEVDKLKKELGDVLFYVSLTASAVDLTLEEIAQTNVDKLSLRYPDGEWTAEASAAKRDEHVVG